MRALVVSHAGKFQAELPHDAIDVALKAPNAILWLDITDPTPEDQSLLLEEFGFHPLAIEDTVRAHERPKVDAYGLPWEEDGGGLPDTPVEAPRGSDWSGAKISELSFAAEDAETTDELAEMVLLPLESLTPGEVEYEAEAARNSYYFVVFYAAAYNAEEDHIEAHAISMFIGANYLVTVHTGSVSHIADTDHIGAHRAARSTTASAPWCMRCSTPWWTTTSL